MVGRLQTVCAHGLLYAVDRCIGSAVCRHGTFNRLRDQTPASATADLPAFTAGRARFVGGPFVRRALFVSSPPALAGDFALLFGGHRCESSTFLAFSSIHRSASYHDVRTFGIGLLR